MSDFTRRMMLQLLGITTAVGCANNDDAETASNDDGPEEETSSAETKLLDEIENFVIVMMENRSFDHFFGALQRDKHYANAAKVNGTTGHETNPWPGHGQVKTYKAETYALESPPHTFGAQHRSWNNGKNDQFVIAGAESKPTATDTGATLMHHPTQVMAYYDRSQIPFYYWLADNFTVCDNWHCSVLGPTFPNRAFVYAGTSEGMEDNSHVKGISVPIWERLHKAKKSGHNYYGSGALYASIFRKRIAKTGIRPSLPMKDFYTAAKDGKLPHVSYIEPDYGSNSDHPEHDIRKGQLLISTIYHALAASPQWKQCCLVIIYDENGGFWDHNPPPAADDANPAFRRLGFRVPALIVGPTVRKGHVSKTVYEHASVVTTLADRFKLPKHGRRERAANSFADVFDPELSKQPRKAPTPPKDVKPTLDAELLQGPFVESQLELNEAIANGELAEDYDARSPEERHADLISTAIELGAVEMP